MLTVNTDNIIDFFCNKKNVCRDSLLGDSIRIKDCATRYMIWYYLHCEDGLSISKIARKFNRTRGSVFRGIRMMRNHIRLYKDVKTEYDGLLNELKGTPE